MACKFAVAQTFEDCPFDIKEDECPVKLKACCEKGMLKPIFTDPNIKGLPVWLGGTELTQEDINAGYKGPGWPKKE